MSVINSDSVRAGASGAADAYTIDQSARFNDDDSAYLSRTPRVAGNRRTWTFSCWYKQGNLGTNKYLIAQGADANNGAFFYNASNNAIRFRNLTASSADADLLTNQLLRDPSAWCHLVCAVDTTQATASDRINLYLNGSLITSYNIETYPSQNFEFDINNTSDPMTIGRITGTANFMDGYMADVHFIDGQQLAASDFGESDENGNWVPIEFDPATAITTTGTMSMDCTDSNSTLTDATTYTHSAMAIGAATATRQVYAIVTGSAAAGTETITSVSIGGVTGTHVLTSSHDADNYVTTVWKAVVPSGTTADVVSVWSGNTREEICMVYSMDNVGQLVDIQALRNGYPLTAEVQTWDGGAVMAYASSGGAGNSTFTWAGVTEDEDVDPGAANFTSSGAAEATSTDAAALTVTATPSGGDEGNGMFITLSFKPVTADYGTNGFHLDFADSSHFGLDPRDTRSALAVSNTADAGDATNTTAYTFSSQSLGAADAERDIYVFTGAQPGSAGAVSTLTVNGVSASLVAASNNSSTYFEWWVARVPTGTTGDVVVTWSASKGNCSISVYRVVGGTFATSTAQGGTDPTTSLDIQGYGGGVVIAGAFAGEGSSTHTWTGPTEDVDAVNAETTSIGTSSKTVSSTGTETVTCNWTAPGGGYGAIAISLIADNDFADSGLAANDQTNDSPTDDAANDVGNYPTFNPIMNNSACVLSNGNRQINSTTNNFRAASMNRAIRLGDTAYWETLLDNGIRVYVGLVKDVTASTVNPIGATTVEGSTVSAYTYAWRCTAANEVYYEASDQSVTVAAAGAGVVVAIGITSDGEVKLYRDDALIHTYTQNLEAGYDYTPLWSVNGYVAEELTIQAGPGDLTYSLPAGTTALDTASRPAPTITDPSKYFQVDTFTGTGAENVRSYTDASSTNVSPDLSWGKDRDTATNHVLTNSVGGAQLVTHSNTGDAEASDAQGLKSFDAGGVTLGTSTEWNAAGAQVIWNWVEDNATAGLDILEYSGTDTANENKSHSLSSAPEMAMVRRLDSGSDMYFWHTALTGADYFCKINGTAAESNSDSPWGTGNWSSSQFMVDTGVENINASGGTYLAMLWHSVAEFSKAFSYIGNANNDGTYVDLGFAPRFIFVFKASAGGENKQFFTWDIETHNDGTCAPLEPNTTGSESAVSTRALDFLARGFKVRTSNDALNTSGATYVGMAFAEFPFGGDGVSQARAR